MLNKLHLLEHTEIYTETQNYKYCFLVNRNGVGISGTIIEETNDLIDDEVEVDIQSPWRLIIQAQFLQSLSLYKTIYI